MKNRTSGFTLVELIVVVVVVGIAVLLFTQIPLFSLSSWTKGTERLKMQRDAHYAMIYIQRKLRPATLYQIDDLKPSQLHIGDQSFILEGNQLRYEDSLRVEPVIEGYTDIQFDAEKIFNVTGTDAVINITLTLVKEKVGTIILRTAVKPRN